MSDSRPAIPIDALEAGVTNRDVSILARALTLIESSRPADAPLAEALVARLLPKSGGSLRLGVTGPPGVGKSTFIEALGMMLVEGGRRVAVLAIDPSSNVTGGSLLGDKTRMSRLAASERAYIRPSPSSASLGGVARRTRECLLACEAAGYDVTIVETVGVGQSETLARDLTDCLLALLQPGAGDDLQGIKRGLMEAADIIAINKADGALRDEAQRAAHDLHMHAGAAPIFLCSAANAEGIEEIWSAISARHAERLASGELAAARRRQNVRWMWSIVEDGLRIALETNPNVLAIRGELERQVIEGALAPSTAASKILEAFKKK